MTNFHCFGFTCNFRSAPADAGRPIDAAEFWTKVDKLSPPDQRRTMYVQFEPLCFWLLLFWAGFTRFYCALLRPLDVRTPTQAWGVLLHTVRLGFILCLFLVLSHTLLFFFYSLLLSFLSFSLSLFVQFN